jgi:hypothetical protein
LPFLQQSNLYVQQVKMAIEVAVLGVNPAIIISIPRVKKMGDVSSGSFEEWISFVMEDLMI